MNPNLIQNKIYEIRGQKIMLDFDLAELYEVETKVLNQAVKRNGDRFPEDFMFRLTIKEWDLMRSQIVTASQYKRNIAASPFVFTEHGVTMLSSILRSERAIKMNIAIVRAFIALRQLAIQHKDLATQLSQLRDEMYDRFGDHDTQLAAITMPLKRYWKKKRQMRKAGKKGKELGLRNKVVFFGVRTVPNRQTPIVH